MKMNSQRLHREFIEERTRPACCIRCPAGCGPVFYATGRAHAEEGLPKEAVPLAVSLCRCVRQETVFRETREDSPRDAGAPPYKMLLQKRVAAVGVAGLTGEHGSHSGHQALL